MNDRTVLIATRGSKLALAQASEAIAALRLAFPETDFTIRIIKTAGDRGLAPPGEGRSDKGIFVKEIEDELADGGCDIAVHSLKDMPVRQPPGLVIAAVMKRANPFDALVSINGKKLDELPPRAKIGTSSPRRAALILAARPDIKIVPMRGNIETRLRKMREGACDALVLSAAGLERLGMKKFLTQMLTPPSFLPSPGQGCIALETRGNDAAMIRIARALNHSQSFACATAERTLLEKLGGGCRVPIAAYAETDAENRKIKLYGCVLTLDGRSAVRGDIVGDARAPEELGATLARDMRERGATALLDAV